ncbi:alpha/beta hydrolase [Streptomyces sp. DSM 44917]|uniref:Alpha/beta hydrolase n=1 Tax=Streptomyces boetiae TaxID=3075541 RepID=A0ABU2LEL0_9ACTN|nr:alpha/beta hydrolase [Streptomyces sp. DSM 44917]MDT0310030.1 alpha/beta hydrolase [Streptomyces sp. DSM 44917]
MLTVTQLQDVPVEWINSVASGWHRAGRDAEDSRDFIGQAFLAPLADSSGETVDTARDRLRLISDNCEYARQQCALVATTLESLADRMAELKRELRSALGEAEAAGYQVGDDGSVSYPAAEGGGNELPLPLLPGGSGSGSAESFEAGTARPSPLPDYLGGVFTGARGPHGEAAQLLANRIGRLLAQAGECDEQIAAALGELTTRETLTVSDATWLDAQADAEAVVGASGAAPDSLIPEDGTPADNRSWWDGLSREEQASVIALFPAEVGALDGLPAEARDQANRAVLRMEEARLDREVARLDAELARNAARQEEAMWNRHELAPLRQEEEELAARRDHLQRQLEGMGLVQEHLDTAGQDGRPEAFLLGIGVDDEEGRFILANGNPDTADHTAVYVPGTGAGLASAGTEINRARDMWLDSHSVSPGEEVSTIAWVGYDAPDNANPFSAGDLLLPDAAQESYARDAAPVLRDFTGGLQAARDGDTGHTTLVGHSYGSTVIGAATQVGDGAIADDILVAGSPGMLVDSAEDLGVGGEHVWAMAGPVFADPSLSVDTSDMIEYDRTPFGPILDFNAPSIDWPNIGDIVPLAGAPFLGPRVPSMESFGANIVPTDSLNHSDYWVLGSRSLRNQALVITERTDLMVTE